MKIFTPVGSLTGLTYLWEPVLMDNPGYLKLRNNFYAFPADGPTRAFRSSQHFAAEGQATPTATASSTCSRLCWE